MELVVLLPYGFLLEDNVEGVWKGIMSVLLPYGFLLEDNITEYYGVARPLHTVK